MGTAEILNSLAMIFIMIVPGFVLKKKKIINKTDNLLSALALAGGADARASGLTGLHDKIGRAHV